jgi:hypothetical protein
VSQQVPVELNVEPINQWGDARRIDTPSPVYDRSGRVAAVVSILVPSEEIPQPDRERLQNEVRLAADKISGFLGYLSQAS